MKSRKWKLVCEWGFCASAILLELHCCFVLLAWKVLVWTETANTLMSSYYCKVFCRDALKTCNIVAEDIFIHHYEQSRESDKGSNNVLEKQKKYQTVLEIQLLKSWLWWSSVLKRHSTTARRIVSFSHFKPSCSGVPLFKNKLSVVSCFE